jgi:tRNA(fMet)-specific endonuclease VapC
VFLSGEQRRVRISVVTVAELFFGARRSRTPESSLTICREFCAAFDLPLSSSAAERSGEVRARLETNGLRIGPCDVLIAGIALAEGRILVAHNTREFGRVPDLRIEDRVAD